ncbi:MAG: hypothetical protein ACE5EN_04735, partial [Nitrospinota bacterium]
INVIEDYSGDVRYLGEIINTGTGVASFVKITFTTYDSNNNVIGSDYSYVNGNLYISNSTGISFETSLGPNEYGSFEVITNVSYNSAASYSFEITYSTYSASPPTILLAVTGNISVMTDFLGDIEFLGEIINNGGGTASFVRIDFTMKNSSGLVIGTSFNYISGSTCLLSSGTTTDTCLAPYEKGSFDIWTVTPAADVWSYYYRIYHSEYAVAKPGLEKTSYYDNFNDLTHDEKIDMRNKIIDDQVRFLEAQKNN